MKIDERYYTKASAKKQFKKLAWLLYWIGSCNFYLHYQVWKAHFYWWHPATWIMYVLSIFMYGFSNIEEIESEMFVNKENRTYPYSRAK